MPIKVKLTNKDGEKKKIKRNAIKLKIKSRVLKRNIVGILKINAQIIFKYFSNLFSFSDIFVLIKKN